MWQISRKAALLLVSFLLGGCIATVPETYHRNEIEQVIRMQDLPPKVLGALPGVYDRKELAYKRKLKDGVISYDVDYERGGKKFSIAFDGQGRIVEEERKIEFSDIPDDLKAKVEAVLSKHYPNYRILLIEEVHTPKEMLLEVFFSHPKTRTGFAEAVFDYRTGEFREFIHIRTKSIQTLN